MPYLNIQTNVLVDSGKQEQVLTELSLALSTALGKSENYVMVALSPNVPMIFSGESLPVAFLELKSLGLQEAQTADISLILCQKIQELLGIMPERIYIEFVAPSRKMWGWNGNTF